MIISVGLTGFVFFALMIIMAKILGKDVPLWVKGLFVFPGVIGFFAMVGSLIALIWA